MLLTKLHIPSTGENLVPRPSLFDKLDKGYSRKLILISAPAGFGKTVLLSEWIKKNNISFVWFSIDSNDNDIAGFLIISYRDYKSIMRTLDRQHYL
jgi:LuxR family maltose regulon positive regulatory protein